jgi:threonine dehydrogenase-like Zn-dependent dehydrogenase
MGNCYHRHYISHLAEQVRNSTTSTEDVFTQIEPLIDVLDAYQAFDQRRPG